MVLIGPIEPEPEAEVLPPFDVEVALTVKAMWMQHRIYECTWASFREAAAQREAEELARQQRRRRILRAGLIGLGAGMVVAGLRWLAG